jgi:hypothetical protein
MFADESWCDDDAQKARWAGWQRAVEEQAKAQHVDAAMTPLRVAILEVGAGGNVTTIRRLAEDTADTIRDCGGVVTLIRVNPDLPLADENSLQNVTISLASYGLAALKRIDEAMVALQFMGETAVAAAEATPLLLQTVPIEEDEEKAVPAGDPQATKPGEVAPSTPEQLRKLREAFDAIDADSSGTLDRDEVRRAAWQLGRYVTGDDLDEAMSQMDLDSNGEVDFAEFCAWWEAGGKLSASERLELKWAQFGARFDTILSSALSASGLR